MLPELLFSSLLTFFLLSSKYSVARIWVTPIIIASIFYGFFSAFLFQKADVKERSLIRLLERKFLTINFLIVWLPTIFVLTLLVSVIVVGGSLVHIFFVSAYFLLILFYAFLLIYYSYIYCTIYYKVSEELKERPKYTAAIILLGPIAALLYLILFPFSFQSL